MRRSAAVALCVLLLAAIGTAFVHRTRHALRANSPPADRVDEHARTAPASAATSLSQPPLEQHSVAQDPAATAAAWLQRADAAIAAKRTRQLGVEVAAITALPPDQAWQQLTQRAHDGDVRAGVAALSLANECTVLADLREQPRRSSGGAGAAAAKDLTPEWQAFAAAIDAHEQARLAQRMDDCQGVGGIMDFVAMAIDRFIAPDNAEIQLAEAADIEDDDEAIAALRALAAPSGNENAQRELGERLMKSRNAAQSAEGFLLLQSLADTDESVADFLAFCLHDGCGGFPPDPAAPSQWMERAAGSGNAVALQKHIDDLIAQGDIVAAWAWADYRLQLAINGCFEFGAPTSIWILQAARTLAALEPRLVATQRAQASADLLALRQRWLPAATANLGCSL